MSGQDLAPTLCSARVPGRRDSWATEASQATTIPLSSLHDPEVGKKSADEDEAPEEPYHVYSRRQMWVLVVMIGVAGMFSGLSSNIYFPSLNAIADDLHVSLSSVNLTITSYLVIQGLSPLVWGSLSDALGRRPIYLASFATYIVANMVLSFSPNFAILLVFRGLQAAGSASTVSIGNGVIQDIAEPSERGSFISFYQAIRNFSIAVGPVVGGLLAQFLGFRSIFILLVILASLATIALLLFLPETMRRIAGNGSLRLRGIYRPLMYLIRREPPGMRDPETPPARVRISLATFVSPLKLLADKGILLNLLFSGIVYTVWSMVTSSTSPLFEAHFQLSSLQLGLAFLPNGLGTIAGSAVIGRLLNRDFAAVESAYIADRGLPDDYKLPPKELPDDFPIERARLRRMSWTTAIFVAAVVGYGLSLNYPAALQRPGWIALPLMLQFFIASASNAVFAASQALVSDLCPGRGAGGAALVNLVRCCLGAVGVAGLDPFLAAVGPGWTFLCLGILVVVGTPLALACQIWGMAWRVQAAQR